jgi:type IV pilus assembly protein PilN
MRLDINLASRPYEDAREFWGRWGTAIAVLAVLSLALIGWTVKSWTDAGRDRHAIANLQQQIAKRDQQRADAQAFLDLSVNHSTRDQSQFVNGLIQRKAFSWTRVFEDLEQVMPPNLHVVSLRPEFNEQNAMQLDMRVVGDNRSAAVDLVHRMEGSKHFQGAQLVQEGASSEAGGGVTATVISTYIPDTVSGGGK